MRRKKGFTLIEMLIVLAIVMVLAVLGASIVKSSFRSKAREISWRMASTVRYLYNSAVTENKTVRLVFDFSSNTYWAESTSEKFLLETSEEKEKKEKLLSNVKKEDKKSADTEKDTKKGTTEKSAGTADGAEGDQPKETVMEPPEATFGSIETPLLSTMTLPSGIVLKDVYTSHDKEPVVGGKAYIYFFQNGSAESAMINFKDDADEKHVSVKIDPFTGDTDIQPDYRKLEETKK